MASPLDILRTRARARATLFASWDIADAEDALRPLVDYAHASGIVHRLGEEFAFAVIAAEFERVAADGAAPN